jgi:uncharacterized protein
MNKNILKNLIAQVLGVQVERAVFCWQGGEPTLAGLDFYRDAVKYQELFSVSGQIVKNNFQTNCILINEEWAKFLARYNFLVGVSFDGPPNLHNFYRQNHEGRDTYKHVLKGIDFLQRYSVDFNILVLLNNLNIRNPKKLYRFLLKQGFRFIQFIPCVERNKNTGEITNFSITPEQYGQFLCEIFDEWTINEVPQVYIRDFDEILISYVTGNTPSCVFSKECGSYVVIEYNGDVYPCDFFVEPYWYLGNIADEQIETMVKGKKFSEFKSKKRKLMNKCCDCNWFNLCNGGCLKHWLQLGLDHNYFCSAYKTFFEYSKQKFTNLKNIVRGKNKMGFPTD